jgi:hypothetical protein
MTSKTGLAVGVLPLVVMAVTALLACVRDGNTQSVSEVCAIANGQAAAVDSVDRNYVMQIDHRTLVLLQDAMQLQQPSHCCYRREIATLLLLLFVAPPAALLLSHQQQSSALICRAGQYNGIS